VARKSFNDEDHDMPDHFTGSSNSDGVALSVDGHTWYRLQGLCTEDGISAEYQRFVVNVSQAARDRDLALGRPTYIKLQHYDNSSITGGDGFTFDDIRLYQHQENQAPVADAGPDQVVDEGAAVALDGSASADPDDGPEPLTFEWTQIQGTPVSLSDAHAASPTFIAPDSPQILVFEIEVCDGQRCAVDSATIEIAEGGEQESTRYSSDREIPIPDNDPSGANDSILVPSGQGQVGSLIVEVTIEHTYMGDLTVTLLHAGESLVLHAQAGGSTDNLNLYVVTEHFAGQDAAGEWRLEVVDSAGWDVGTLMGWAIEI